MHKGGTITTDRRTGRFRVRVSVAGKRVTLPGSFASEHDARGALAEFWKGYAASNPASSAGLITVADWGEQYLDARETDGVHRSVDRDRARWSARIAKSAIGSSYIDTLTAKDVRAWLADQIKTPTARGKKPAKQTVVNALNLLRVALEAAVEAGHIESNPSRDVRMPRIARDTEGWDWLRAVDIQRVLGSDMLTSEQCRIFTVAIFTGLRKGELWGLRWQDVDLDRAELAVCRSYGGPTKGGVVRRVPLFAPALAAIKAQPRKCSLVFPTHDVRMRNRNDSAGWEDVADSVGVRRVRFHDLRHTCASHLLQGTWAPELMDRALRLEEVQVWLGHKSISVTQRYAHLCADSIRGRVRRGGSGGGREWTPVDAEVAEEAAQVVDILEARTGFEPVYDGFANPTGMRVIAGGCDPRRPFGDRAEAVLRTFAAGRRPSDLEVIGVITEAIRLTSSGRASEASS